MAIRVVATSRKAHSPVFILVRWRNWQTISSNVRALESDTKASTSKSKTHTGSNPCPDHKWSGWQTNTLYEYCIKPPDYREL